MFSSPCYDSGECLKFSIEMPCLSFSAPSLELALVRILNQGYSLMEPESMEIKFNQICCLE